MKLISTLSSLIAVSTLIDPSLSPTQQNVLSPSFLTFIPLACDPRLMSANLSALFFFIFMMIRLQSQSAMTALSSSPQCMKSTYLILHLMGSCHCQLILFSSNHFPTQKARPPQLLPKRRQSVLDLLAVQEQYAILERNDRLLGRFTVLVSSSVLSGFREFMKIAEEVANRSLSGGMYLICRIGSYIAFSLSAIFVFVRILYTLNLNFTAYEYSSSPSKQSQQLIATQCQNNFIAMMDSLCLVSSLSNDGFHWSAYSLLSISKADRLQMQYHSLLLSTPITSSRMEVQMRRATQLAVTQLRYSSSLILFPSISVQYCPPNMKKLREEWLCSSQLPFMNRQLQMRFMFRPISVNTSWADIFSPFIMCSGRGVRVKMRYEQHQKHKYDLQSRRLSSSVISTRQS